MNTITARTATLMSTSNPSASLPVETKRPAQGRNNATEQQKEAEQIAQDAFGDINTVEMLEEAYKEIAEVRSLLAAAEADDVKAEIIKYKRIADVSNRRQNELMDTVNHREKELQRMSNILRRIGKALDENDVFKLAAMAEKICREHKSQATNS